MGGMVWVGSGPATSDLHMSRIAGGAYLSRVCIYFLCIRCSEYERIPRASPKLQAGEGLPDSPIFDQSVASRLGRAYAMLGRVSLALPPF